METQKLLKWQIEMGANESITSEPINHLQLKPEHTSSTLKGVNPKQNVEPTKGPLSTIGIKTTAKLTAKNCKTIEELSSSLQKFSGLSIQKTATNTIFLDGNLKSNILIISDVPRNEDDASGQLFSGESGAILDKALSYIGLSRDNTAYMPAVFWRPPGNRRPTKEETDACEPFIYKTIEILQPKAILLVSALGYNILYREKTTIAKIQGKLADYEYKNLSGDTLNCKTFSIQHPSILLKNFRQKAMFWSNLLNFKNFLSDNNAT